MKAVVGSVAQSKRIQLAKAASSFARFAAAAAAAAAADESASAEQYARAAYLRLASSAFDELVKIEAEGGVGEKAERRKKGKRGSDEDDGMETGDEGVDSNVKRLRTMM